MPTTLVTKINPKIEDLNENKTKVNKNAMKVLEKNIGE